MHPTLDLHRETAEAARRRTRAWLETQRAAGERVVIVVTGRGRHSAGPPVLPGEIEDLLRSLRGTLVAGYHAEPGGGALRVSLRPPSRGPSVRRSARTAPADAALRREAEEALAELGVTPTPELVDAEVRRRQREAE